MNRVIVTTTIHEPTPALVRFHDHFPHWALVIAADKKTPLDQLRAKLPKAILLSCRDQEKIDRQLSALIGWNSIQRRNMAFIYAIQQLRADVIATVDDDNVPMLNWGQQIFVGQSVGLNVWQTPEICFDPLSVTNHRHLWHRGYPLQLIKARSNATRTHAVVSANVQANLWNGDPDVDAIGRFVYQPQVKFRLPQRPFASNAKFSPFNSQNTILSAEALRHYMVLPHIGRMDDIWGGYYLQALGYRVIYGKATVVQRRNAHDGMVDFEAELLGYRQSLNLLRALDADPRSIRNFIPEASYSALKRYEAIMKA